MPQNPPTPDLRCVREPDLRAFVLGELPVRVDRLVADHLSTCAACESKARLLDKATDPVIRGIRRTLGGNKTTHAPEITPTAESESKSRTTTPPPGYETLREIGRGGMGVVYLARQRHPHRLVAIKVLLAGVHSGAAGIARFLAEADAIARLQHPNIVQIYEVGEHGGLPYFVLEYVEGGSLADWLHGEPQPHRAAAEFVQSLARAIHFAHQQGVIHRDLKPSNVLMHEKRDANEPCPRPLTHDLDRFTPKVADFGLAKQSGPELTATGEMLGTPGYMAPEQAAGGAIGPAADVWALGAILYECLTGHPPFCGSTHLETLEQVRTQEAVPPEQLRPGLPRDLSTVCLKCLEKDPKRRYDSAASLADDLERVLNDRPPLARRSSRIERCGRWCRRNPLVAGLAAAIGVMLPSALVTVSYLYWQSDADRRRAEANFLRASGAVQGMTDAGQKLFFQKGTEDVGRKIIEKAAQFHEGFVSDQRDNPTVLLEAARGWTRAAWYRADLGQIDASIQASVRAVELFDRLLSSDPRNKDFRFERALRLRAIGEHHTFWDKDPKAAEQAFIAARSALQELSDEFPDNILYAGNLSNVMMNTAVMLADQYRYDEAEPLFEETIRLQTQWLARGKSGYDFQTEMAFSHEAFGVLLWRRDRNPRGEQLCSQARKTFTEFAEKHPRNYEVAWLSARTTLALADMARDAGRLADAEREYRAALARLDAVRRERAAFFKYAVTQLDVAAKLAGVIRDSGRRDEAIIAFKSAAVLAEKLVKEFPAEPVASGANPSVAHIPYAKLLVEAGRHAEADATLRFALKFWPTDAALNEEIRLLGAANSQMGRTD